jgi:hypothetical protein
MPCFWYRIHGYGKVMATFVPKTCRASRSHDARHFNMCLCIEWDYKESCAENPLVKRSWRAACQYLMTVDTAPCLKIMTWGFFIWFYLIHQCRTSWSHDARLCNAWCQCLSSWYHDVRVLIILCISAACHDLMTRGFLMHHTSLLSFQSRLLFM